MPLGEIAYHEKGKNHGSRGITFEYSEIDFRGSKGDSVGKGLPPPFPGLHDLTAGSAEGVWRSKDGETVVWRSLVMSREVKSRNRYIAVVTYTTDSPKLSWLNGRVVIAEGNGDPATGEFTETGYLWDWAD